MNENRKMRAGEKAGFLRRVGLGALVVLFAVAVSAKAGESVLPKPDVSFRNEIQHAIDNGTRWLQQNQKTNGSWSSPDQPAVTALALSALVGDSSARARDQAAIQKGYKFILAHIKPDRKSTRLNSSHVSE